MQIYFKLLGIVGILSLLHLPVAAEPRHRKLGSFGKSKDDKTSMGIRIGVGESTTWSKDAAVETFSTGYTATRMPNRCENPEANLLANLSAAGKALDEAEKHAAEWGHASIASAVLVDTQRLSTGFSIEANTSYETFAKAAREGRQGAAARYIEETFKTKLEVEYGQSTMQEREDRITEAEQQRRFYQKQYEAELERRRLEQLRNAPMEDTPTPVERDVDPPQVLPPLDLLPELPTTAVFVGSNFNSGQGLLQTPEPPAEGRAPNLTELALLADELRPSEGDVMKVAASNVVTQRILNYLTKPVEPGYDHVPWFMVTQVSVSPGSRTFRDYVAETTLHPFYATTFDTKTNVTVVEAKRGNDIVHPGIFAAFPLVEAQALDLRNSERYETQISLALAAKLLAEGKQAEAKFFLEKMTKVQQDVATRTLLPVVVPSSNGKEVTYRFDPGLQGLVEPGNRKKGSGMVLNANSVPALIVIMTDRKSLKKYSHLYFELHTRWMPKKKANIWSSTWDGVVRNYNPRTGMLPSDVISAAVSLDQGTQYLQHAMGWATEGMGLSEQYQDSFRQVELRRSVLHSKLGSTTSNIALPVHYNIIPGGDGLVLDSRYEQKIMVERVSGTDCDPSHPQLNLLSSVQIGGFPFVSDKEYEKLKRSAENLVAEVDVIATHEVRSALAEVKSDLDRNLENLLPEDKSIFDTMSHTLTPSKLDPEALKSVRRMIEHTPAISSQLSENTKSRLEEAETSIENSVGQATAAVEKVKAMGWFEWVDSRNVVVTLPADRSWTLPTGTHPVAGRWDDGGRVSAVTFGTIRLTDLDGIYVAPTAAVTIPAKLPTDGLSITVTGRNLDRVRSAYWNEGLKTIAIVSQGKEKLVLRVTARPPTGTKEIFISDTLPPDSAITTSFISRNIVGSVPVTIQEEPKASLRVTSSKVAIGDKGVLQVTFEGEFPDGEILVTAATEHLTRHVTPVERSSKAFTVGVVRAFISNVMTQETSAKFTLIHTPSKASVAVTVPLADTAHQIAAVLPTELNASVINGASDASLKIFGSFPNGPLEVYVGGILVHDIAAKEIPSPIEVPLTTKDEDKYHKNLGLLKRKSGGLKLMLVANGNLYEWKDDIVISGD